MAVLSRGTTITPTTTVTAQTLHDLIELAQVGTVLVTDLAGDVQLIKIQTTAPNPTQYPFWYDPRLEDPIFRVFASPWNCWVAVGPHRIEVPMINAAATDLRMGALVVSHTAASSFSIGSTPSLNAIGFIQSSCPSGGTVGVAITGIGYAMWACGFSNSRFPVPGDWVHGRHVQAGCVNAVVGITPHSNWSGSNYGVFMESTHSGNTFTFGLYRVAIWGGRVSHQVNF